MLNPACVVGIIKTDEIFIEGNLFSADRQESSNQEFRFERIVVSGAVKTARARA